MKLFVIGDYQLNDNKAPNDLFDHLDYLHYATNKEIESLHTFDELGVDYWATAWAYDNQVPFSTYNSNKSEFPLNSAGHAPNSYLRNIVDSFKIDTFYFHFIPNNPNASLQQRDVSYHRDRVRDMFRRTLKSFRSYKVYSNYEKPPQ